MGKKTNTVGVDTLFTLEIAEKICEKIATSDKGLKHISKENGFPHPATIYRWLDKHENFRDMYARAKELQAEYVFDQILDIADDKSNDVTSGEFGLVPNGVNVQRSRLQVDARKWVLAKLNPRKYGDKVQTEHSGTVGISQITGMEIK